MARADKVKVTEWKEHALPPATRKALRYCSEQQWFRRLQWYLAGGTALTLYFGHRRSLDLDFFTPQKKFQAHTLIDRFPPRFWETDILQNDTVYGRLYEAKVSFIAYPHFVPQYPYYQYGHIDVLDPRDIATMKIVAISQRGSKRDFFDLFWNCQHQEPLLLILQRLARSYPAVGHNYHHILYILIYFVDAESDPTPQIYFDARWSTVKKYFQQYVPAATKKLLSL